MPFNGDWLDPRCQSGSGQIEKRKAVPSPLTLFKNSHDKLIFYQHKIFREDRDLKSIRRAGREKRFFFSWTDWLMTRGSQLVAGSRSLAPYVPINLFDNRVCSQNLLKKQ
ncbi:hypothetical protein CUU66_18060 [Peribacillus deserti]|uniref:Uncharacterized protein n=1 Tax=Peribacillus deserti TaxID=673318 RepID=A0A2N5M2G4_9BACI|nr:hypothetical protein CUU66_18060 [Peribacillus deserti]